MENKNITLIAVHTEIGECVLHLGGHWPPCMELYRVIYSLPHLSTAVRDRALPPKLQLAHREVKYNIQAAVSREKKRRCWFH